MNNISTPNRRVLAKKIFRQANLKCSFFCILFLINLDFFAQAQKGKSGDKSISFAAGLDLGIQIRNEYPTSSYNKYIPEIVTFGYLNVLSSSVYLRPGARYGYSGLNLVEMPSALRVEEVDHILSGELGIVADGFLVPSITAGLGAVFRTISLKTTAPIVLKEDKISRSETLPYFYIQIGCGLPIWNGFFLLEPFVRFENVTGDDRARKHYGFEFTSQIF